MSNGEERGFLEFWVDNDYAPYLYSAMYAAFQAGAEWQLSQQSVPAGYVLVPVELLERCLYLMDNYIGTMHPEEDELRSLLAASPKTESQPISEKRVSKMARILSERFARDYDVDIGDHWTLHGTELIEDVHAMLEGSKGDE